MRTRNRRTVRCKLRRDALGTTVVVTAVFDPAAPLVLTDINPSDLTHEEEMGVLVSLMYDGKVKDTHFIPPDLPQVEWFLNLDGHCEMREVEDANER